MLTAGAMSKRTSQSFAATPAQHPETAIALSCPGIVARPQVLVRAKELLLSATEEFCPACHGSRGCMENSFVLC
jgi:hypothetical protein